MRLINDGIPYLGRSRQFDDIVSVSTPSSCQVQTYAATSWCVPIELQAAATDHSHQLRKMLNRWSQDCLSLQPLRTLWSNSRLCHGETQSKNHLLGRSLPMLRVGGVSDRSPSSY